MFTIAITGHRPVDLYGYDLSVLEWVTLSKNIEEFLLEKLKEHNALHCISGMALGVDQLFGLLCVKMKKAGYNITVEAAIPCKNHTSRWKDATHWEYIKDNADVVTMITDDLYTHECMQKRNEYMVNKSDLVIAVWTGKKSGGTYNCIQYAVSKDIPVYNILQNGLITVEDVLIIEPIMLFRGKYAYLSNFYSSPIKLELYPELSNDWLTVEHYFQAAKMQNIEDAKHIQSLQSPSEAKKQVYKLTMKSDWEQIKETYMKNALIAKFTQHIELRQKLIETFPALLVEGNNHKDMYWGFSNGRGQNRLGYLLMEIRYNLINEK